MYNILIELLAMAKFRDQYPKRGWHCLVEEGREEYRVAARKMGEDRKLASLI
jgi:hypothetical protein